MLGLDLSQEPRAIREAKEEGREEQAIALIVRQLTRRFKQELPEKIRARLALLPLSLLEDLSEALLDFTRLPELKAWLNRRSHLLQQTTKKLDRLSGNLDETMRDALIERFRQRILTLSDDQLEQFGEVLPDFTDVEELQTWLQQHPTDSEQVS